MLKKNLMIVGMLVAGLAAQAQGKYFTKTGRVEFYSKAPLEDIEAKNKTATAVLDSKSGALQFSVAMKGFEFPKALMQEHFNENYVQSDKYPKAEFKGNVINNGDVNYAKEGTYNVKVKGKMSLHGETKEVEAAGTIKVAGNQVFLNSIFNLQLSDYKISIPGTVKDKISNTIRVTVDSKLDPLKS